jgi:serine/threonine protein kinase
MAPDSPIKLIDFGLSERYNKNEKMNRACGTVYTAAPEVLTGSTYTTKTDVWSAGVCAFVLIGKEVPFMSDIEDMRDARQVEKLKAAKFVFSPLWAATSKPSREFVSTCLRRHPGSRWSSKEALEFLQGKWLPAIRESAAAKNPPLPPPPSSSSSFFSSPAPKAAPPAGGRRKRIDSVMMRSFTDFGNSSELKKKILMTMAYTMDKSELKVRAGKARKEGLPPPRALR